MLHLFTAFALATGTCLGVTIAGHSSLEVREQTNSGQQWTSEPFYPSPWMNPKASSWEDAYKQARSFVEQLTLMEKVNLTTGVGWENGPCVGNTGSVPRLGFKGICNQDAPQGIRFADYVSAFTSGQTAAATWDKQLIYERGAAMAAEHRAKGVTMQLGPVAGPLGRVPEGGRNWEGFAADPMLTGVAMAETIRGMQDNGIIASAKHFIGNEQERYRQVGEAANYGYNISSTLSSNIDDRTLHEMYLWPFADAVRAGVGSILCSYTQINNSYGCQNSKTLNNILKNELGFQGFVVSDWAGHQSGVSSALAGLDMSMPGDTAFDTGYSYWGSNLTISVLNGTMPQWRVNDMAMRIMAAYFKVGNTIENQPDVNFNSWTTDTYGYKYAFGQTGYDQVNWHVDVRADHAKQIRETAAKGTVLLKNVNKTLPLKSPKFMAVFGEDAGAAQRGPNGCADRGCDNGTLAMGWGSGTSNFPYLITPDASLSAKVAADGGRYESVLDNWNSAEAIDALAKAPPPLGGDKVCVVFGNADSGEGFINVDGNAGDRNNLTLWQNGDAVIKNVTKLCDNTVVVLHTVGPVIMSDWIENPNVTAVVWAGLPGQESGNSLVDILYGAENPAGRSPFTWARRRDDYAAKILYKPNNGEGPPQQEFKEGVFIDYRHFDEADIKPEFEFGFGLSYTTFEYSNIRVSKRPSIRPYKPTSGWTSPAPSFGNFSYTLTDYTLPKDYPYPLAYLYPYLNSTSSLQKASLDPDYGRTDFIPKNSHDGTAQPLLPAGDSTAGGGNAGLYDVLYDVSATVTNTGDIAGDEVAQLYVDLGESFDGFKNPPRQLRGFDRLRSIQPGQSVTFRVQLTRRDLANWDPVTQNWVVGSQPKTVYIGSSSRKLPLKMRVPQ